MILIFAIPIVALAIWIYWKIFDNLFKEGRRKQKELWNPKEKVEE